MAASKKREPAPPQLLRALAQDLERSGPARAYAFRGEEPWFQERGLELVNSEGCGGCYSLARDDA